MDRAGRCERPAGRQQPQGHSEGPKRNPIAPVDDLGPSTSELFVKGLGFQKGASSVEVVTNKVFRSVLNVCFAEKVAGVDQL